MEHIKQGIYFEDSFLGVTLGALVTSHGTIMIDAPLRPEDARSWRSALINHRGGTNRLLVLLDSHLDRTLGARIMESTIVSHLQTAQTFSNRPAIFKGQSFESGSEWETYDDAIGTRWTAPNITFTKHMILHWGGTEVHLEHHPGPTQGSIWFVAPNEQVVFVGDTVTPNQPPYLSDADLPTWIETLDLLTNNFRDYVIVSGRAGIVTIEDVREQRRHLKKISQRLERLVNRDAPPEDTEKLIRFLLRDFSFPRTQTERFTQRYRTGLYQYYNRHFSPAGPHDLPDSEG
ncbi:MAG: MBL fold metallo-hydrolase [Anaerolineales bacterium]|nr:MBL fold metallo-hydrolase [Anaerolineales bacterium]MCK4978228.1 MBL fold metallo-hydrolase [Anaerolineales bacterium]